jgi:hypothetical protein
VTVGGTVQIEGTASSPGFSRAVIEIGRGLVPNAWDPLTTLDRPVTNGTLAIWNTASLPNGIYVIRVTVYDSNGGTVVSSTVLTVRNGN